MSKIIVDNSFAQSESSGKDPQQEELRTVKENKKNGAGHTKFPEWDILPPHQVINPRIKRN